MKRNSFIGASIAVLLSTAGAFAGPIEAMSGTWETNPDNCSRPASEGYGLQFDGTNSFYWVNHATEGGVCTIDGAQVTCGTEEGEQLQATVGFRMSGDTLYATGPWQDGETAYASCEMAPLDLMP